MGSAAKRVWRAVPHDGGTGAQDRRGDFATRRLRVPRGMAAQSGRSPGPSRDTRRCGGEGRLIVAHVVGQDGKRFKLYLFTSGEEPREMWVELYRRRWDIELDIRSLKQTLRMHSLSAQTPEMAEKELLLAIAGYNLVRSVQMQAAREADLEPRRLSFSRVQAVVMTALPRLATLTDAAEWATEYKRVLGWAAQGKLPNRTRQRSYPRAVWGRGSTFPKHQRKEPTSAHHPKGGK